MWPIVFEKWLPKCSQRRTWTTKTFLWPRERINTTKGIRKPYVPVWHRVSPLFPVEWHKRPFRRRIHWVLAQCQCWCVVETDYQCRHQKASKKTLMFDHWKDQKSNEVCNSENYERLTIEVLDFHIQKQNDEEEGTLFVVNCT